MDYNFNELSFDELKEIKSDVMEIMKEKREEKKESDKLAKAEEREELSNVGRDLCKIGNVVLTTYKGEEVLATITKINENTVSVSITDLEGNPIMKDGKAVKTWKYLYQISENA